MIKTAPASAGPTGGLGTKKQGNASVRLNTNTASAVPVMNSY